MDDVGQVLMDRLVKKGADASHVASLLKALSKILSQDPNTDPAAANERLRYLGWQEVQVDYHTLQLALAYFELNSGNGASAFGTDDTRRRAMRLREVEVAPVAHNDA
jgi:hypothetical protein